jgi:FtsP/CotA-like multicopper oxidase with cupredoxin domain
MPHPAPFSRRRLLALAAASPLSLALPARAQTVVPATAATAAAPRALTLTAGEASRRLRPEPAPTTATWAFTAEPAQGPAGGEQGGPVVLRMRRGETLAVTLVNRLQQPLTFHVYGLRHANGQDGVAGLTEVPVQPGQSREYRITPQDAGTFWFHSLVPGQAAEQVERGLAGVLVVEEEAPPAVDLDLPLVLDDVRVNEGGQIDPAFASRMDAARMGRLGNLLTANGRAGALEQVAAPGSRVRLRLVSSANARIMPMRFEGFGAASIVAIDGQPCEPFDPLRRQVVLLPGSRYDAMLDLPAEAGAAASVIVGLGAGIAVATFRSQGQARPARSAAGPLSPNVLPPMIRLQDATRVDLTISGGAPAPVPGAPTDEGALARALPDARRLWVLNGGRTGGLDGRPLFSVKRGAVCVLALSNRTAWSQVLHVHGHVFRLLHPLDDGWEPYFLDTLMLQEGRTSRIAFIADNPGRWAIRSSILDHLDAGVLTWFEVT